MKSTQFILSIITVSVLRFLDLYITYIYTPDLESEWNPLVSIFGVSWTGFIITQILIVAAVSALMFFYFSRKPPVIEDKNLSFNDFIYVYFFGRLRPWPHRMFSVPKNWRRHLEFNGFLFFVVTTAISILAIANNLMLVSNVSIYTEFVGKHYSIMFPAGFAVLTVITVFLFFGREYRKYKSAVK